MQPGHRISYKSRSIPLLGVILRSFEHSVSTAASNTDFDIYTALTSTSLMHKLPVSMFSPNIVPVKLLVREEIDEIACSN